MKTLYNFFLFSLASLILISCSNNYYAEVQSLPNEKWSINNPLSFKINIEDSMQYFNMYFLIRNTTDFETQNFYVFMKTKYPDGIVEQDTLGFILCDKYGNWTGKGRGRLKDNKFLFQTNIRFPKNGEYVFTVTQSMRNDVVEGISNFGIILENYEPKKQSR